MATAAVFSTAFGSPATKVLEVEREVWAVHKHSTPVDAIVVAAVVPIHREQQDLDDGTLPVE